MEEFLEAVFSVQSTLRLNSDDTRQIDNQSWVRVSGYQSTVLICIVRHHYQAMTIEVTEDVVFAVAICIVCRLMKSVIIICSYEL